MYGQPYTAATEAAVRHELHGSDPSVVADVICHAIRSPRPHARYLVGADAHLLAAAALLPTRVQDALRLRALGLRRPGQTQHHAPVQ